MRDKNSISVTQIAEHGQHVVAVLAVVVLVMYLGGYSDRMSVDFLLCLDIAIIIGFVAADLVKLAAARQRAAFLRDHALQFILIALLLILLGVVGLYGERAWLKSILPLVGAESLRVLVLGMIRIYIALVTLLRTVHLHRLVSQSRLHPAATLVISFLLVIALGAALLAGPRSHARERVPFVDALFTATSATCVTGLVVKDTGSDFSLFGQGVILVLIQIGGLGLMTFTAFFAIFLGLGMGVREGVVMKDVLNVEILGRIGRLIFQILALTFIIEAVGAALFYFSWPDTAVSGARRLYFAVFHSVSAFCNAGFSLYPDSFERFGGSVPFVLVLACLIVLGGLGFRVLSETGSLVRHRLRIKRSVGDVRGRTLQVRRLSLHSKIVLATTGILLLAGFFALLALESSASWRHHPPGARVLSAVFQSVTARTAGFSTANIGAMGGAGLLILYFLMFIGASPGSTGGGVKTSTFAINVLAVAAAIRGRGRVEAFKRTIPAEIVRRAFVVVTLAACVVATSTLLLLALEDADVRALAFESMSAFGTVGLSTGITGKLGSPAKLVVAATIFVGRIGPLTMMLAISSRLLRPESYEYPSERVTIG